MKVSPEYSGKNEVARITTMTMAYNELKAKRK